MPGVVVASLKDVTDFGVLFSGLALDLPGVSSVCAARPFSLSTCLFCERISKYLNSLQAACNDSGVFSLAKTID